MVRNWSTSYGVHLTDQKLCMVDSSLPPPRAAVAPLETPSNACNVHQLGCCLSVSYTLGTGFDYFLTEWLPEYFPPLQALLGGIFK